ncbi:MAG: hypothetical protein D6738_03655 [Acidobacteria bacterium]|nr:MAG: hypothetical protein D6738_03655 [Acidobacteriota bacterium]
MTDDRSSWYFEAPLDRRGLRVRALLALMFAAVLGLVAAEALTRGSLLGAGLGVLVGVSFVLLAGLSLRRSINDRPPLILDEGGVSVDDGLGTAWRLRWDEVEAVLIARSPFGRRVLLRVRRDPDDALRPIPSACVGNAPPEWLAGLIETFRQHALHPAAD